MRKKIFYIIVISSIITSIIYAIFKTDKISFLALGDSVAKGVTPYGGYSSSYNDYIYDYLEKKNAIATYYKDFTAKDLRTSDLVNMITNNEYIMHNNKKLTVQQAMVKSDFITIFVGSYDLYNHLGITNGGESVKNQKELNEYFISMLTDLNNLIDLIQKYTTAKIVLIGFYNPMVNAPDELINIFEYLDSAYKTIAEKHECYFISTNQEISSNEEYLPNSSDIHINYKAHELIAKKIIHILSI